MVLRRPLDRIRLQVRPPEAWQARGKAVPAVPGPDAADAGWRGRFVTQNAIVDPEGNETPRGVLRNDDLVLPYCRELAGRIGYKQEIARWRRLREAA